MSSFNHGVIEQVESYTLLFCTCVEHPSQEDLSWWRDTRGWDGRQFQWTFSGSQWAVLSSFDQPKLYFGAAATVSDCLNWSWQYYTLDISADASVQQPRFEPTLAEGEDYDTPQGQQFTGSHNLQCCFLSFQHLWGLTHDPKNDLEPIVLLLARA